MDARRASAALIEVLARLHAVDFASVGLSDLGRPDGYLERQLRRWAQQWKGSATRDLPAIEDLARRLHASLPLSGPPAVVHGDYRFDNAMFDPCDWGRVVAVLDWKMATLGDPLTDLGMLLAYWDEGAEDPWPKVTLAKVAHPAFPTRAKVATAYAAATGRDLDQMDWYVVFALLKLVVIAEGIY